MQPSEMAFYTTQELIEELMRRETFCGVVVHDANERKSTDWSEERIFRVHFNQNLDAQRASRLLESVAEFLDFDPA